MQSNKQNAATRAIKALEGATRCDNKALEGATRCDNKAMQQSEIAR
jgi:hypothetical protein